MARSKTRALVPLLAALMLLVMSPGLSAADAFLSVIEDLPLMPGLAEDTDGAVNFESAGGRIAEAHAAGPVKPTDVMAFYSGVLPQLGWKQSGPGQYVRDKERLKLAVEKAPQGAVVTFSVHPLTR